MTTAIAATGAAVFALGVCQWYNLKIIGSLMKRVSNLEHLVNALRTHPKAYQPSEKA